ncbi:MAG: hypothetical protein LBE31_12065, partial [Deltaproteobacteria bacterium]|nr:hypothetical protein [Deltaproteobacteria bacterium]
MPQEQLPARPLFVRGLNWLGDAVMSLPALNALVNSGQTLKVLTRIGSASLYRNVSGVSEVLVEQKSFMGRLKTCLTLTQERFSGALVLPNSFSSALTAFLGLIPSRVGYARNVRSPLLSKAVPVRRRDLAVHQSFYFLRLVEAMGLAAPFTRPQINPPQTPFPIALPSGFRLAIAPGAAYGGAKRWPAEKFAEAARLILANHPGTAVILGGPSEIIAA